MIDPENDKSSVTLDTSSVIFPIVIGSIFIVWMTDLVLHKHHEVVQIIVVSTEMSKYDRRLY